MERSIPSTNPPSPPPPTSPDSTFFTVPYTIEASAGMGLVALFFSSPAAAVSASFCLLEARLRMRPRPLVSTPRTRAFTTAKKKGESGHSAAVVEKDIQAENTHTDTCCVLRVHTRPMHCV